MTEDTGGQHNRADNESAANVVSSARTPLYAASNSERYHRQDLIKEIQQESEFRLISYVSGDFCRIERDDALQFRDLLHRISDGQNIELLLHTPGGDIDAAEWLVSMIREKVGDAAAFRIVVPHIAKSAGTLMVLGADNVVMSDTSELGPIDPQVLIPDSMGILRWVAAQNYLDAYDTHSEALREDPQDSPSQIMFNKLDPVVHQRCIAAKERSRRLAEDLLRRGMFREGGNWTATADRLIDTKEWQTHSQGISQHDAIEIGLQVNRIEPHNDLWQKYWRLYCLQRLATPDREKLFESDYVSLSTACRDT